MARVDVSSVGGRLDMDPGVILKGPLLDMAQAWLSEKPEPRFCFI